MSQYISMSRIVDEYIYDDRNSDDGSSDDEQYVSDPERYYELWEDPDGGEEMERMLRGARENRRMQRLDDELFRLLEFANYDC